MASISFSEHPATQKLPEERLEEDNGTNNSNESPQAVENTSQLPIVVLEVDCITDTVAARLATSLLGHVLFLKNQIPLSVTLLCITIWP